MVLYSISVVKSPLTQVSIYFPLYHPPFESTLPLCLVLGSTPELLLLLLLYPPLPLLPDCQLGSFSRGLPLPSSRGISPGWVPYYHHRPHPLPPSSSSSSVCPVSPSMNIDKTGFGIPVGVGGRNASCAMVGLLEDAVGGGGARSRCVMEALVCVNDSDFSKQSQKDSRSCCSPRLAVVASIHLAITVGNFLAVVC